jgi:hypothetical protein
MKHAAEIFRIGTPGRHEILMQVAEDDLVVSHIVGRGVHEGELFGIPATNKEVETDGIVIHRVRDGQNSRILVGSRRRACVTAGWRNTWARLGQLKQKRDEQARAAALRAKRQRRIGELVGGERRLR